MRLIPESEIELKIETGIVDGVTTQAFGFGGKKERFTICERTDGALAIISEAGKTLQVEISESRRIVTIQSM